MGGPRAWTLICLGLLLPGGGAAWNVPGARFSGRRLSSAMAECDTSGQEELSPEVGLLEHFAGKPLSSPHLQMGTARNWCSYVVTRTVSCHVQNGTYLQRVLQNCPWPMGCPGSSYRTVVRPTYKVMYKTVTAREWRCCPGHSGVTCEEGRKAWDVGPGTFVECLPSR
ncbi:hypothetical protein U0070_019407 [Myodes glareolus]|uniref:EMI domain-containing protein n=1 Tax=Myodes glareolus TaxID=447135 RepID=A0AAW0HCP1_MYOGA